MLTPLVHLSIYLSGQRDATITGGREEGIAEEEGRSREGGTGRVAEESPLINDVRTRAVRFSYLLTEISTLSTAK